MKRGFSGEHIPLFDSMLIHDQPGQGEGPTLTVESQHTPIASPTTSQPTTSQPMSSQEQPSQVPTTEPIITTSSPPLYETTIPHTTSSMPHDSPLSGGDTPGSDEGSKKLNELTELCTKLFDKVTSLEKDLKQTKKVYGKALTKLVKKVKYLEDKLKSTTERRKARMVISDDDEDLVSEDPSNQGRMTKTKYEDVDVETEYEEVEYELDQIDTLQQITPAKERIAQKLNEEEMAKAATREGQERIDFEKQLDEREETDNIDWSIVAEQVQERQSYTIKRYQTLKKKPVSVAQARKNIMIYLKNMAGYKMGYFKGMSYDEINPFEEETLLQESFMKLRTVEASSSEPIQEQPTEEPKELSEEELKKMLEIVLVEEIKSKALQVNVTPTLALTNFPANVEGENATNTATEEPSTHTEGDTKDPKMATPRIDKGKGIATESDKDPSKKLMTASSIVHPDPDEQVKVEFMINGKMVYLTEQEIQDYWDKEEQIKKAKEQARLLAIFKPKVIKVVQEEAEKIRHDQKKITSCKARKKFKKAQDAEHQVLKGYHSKKVRKSLELKKHKYDRYMWTISSRLKPEPITDIKIHPKTKSVVITVYKGTDGRNFDVHNPFIFGKFGISELDELREIIPKKKNVVVKDLMNSLSQRYERIRKILNELGIQSALPAPVPEQASSQTSRRKRKRMELEPKVKVPGLECNRSLPEGVLFVNNMVIEDPEYGIFFIDVFGDQAF
ncbi:hypothetical protein Tco_0364462 [Tanacetum coccineum]